MIQNIGGTSAGNNLNQTSQPKGLTAQSPQAPQAAPAGDGVNLNEAREIEAQGTGSQNMDALLNGLNENTGTDQAGNNGEITNPQSVEEKKAYVQQEIQKTKAEISRIDNEIKKIDSDISNYKQELGDIDNQISQAQGGNEKDKGKNDQKIQELNQKKTQINQRISELEQKKKSLESEKKKLEDYLKQLEETAKKLEGHCNANRKVDMPQKPESADKKDEAEWETKLEQDIEAVNQEKAAQGENPVQNQTPDALGNKTPDNKAQDATPALDAAQNNKEQKPAGAALLGEAGNGAGKEGGQAANPITGKDNVKTNDQNESPAVMKLRNDWEMCKQEGADAQVKPETKQAVYGILGIQDDNAEGKDKAGLAGQDKIGRAGLDKAGQNLTGNKLAGK
ncbi:MAG: hypothetical protein AB2L14_28995 [Candidatus Xenobiia bacterium LiM19]